MTINVIVKAFTEAGKYALDEIKGIKEGDIVNGDYNSKNNSVSIALSGKEAVLFIGENCKMTKSSKSEVERTNALSKISISDEIKNNENEYRCGTLKDKLVTLIYHNKKSDKESDRKMTYSNAFNLAINRAYDGRYKNFNFIIQ